MQLTPTAFKRVATTDSAVYDYIIEMVERQKQYTRIDMLVYMTKFYARENRYKKQIALLQTQFEEQRYLNKQLSALRVASVPQQTNKALLVIVQEIEGLVKSVVSLRHQAVRVEDLVRRATCACAMAENALYQLKRPCCEISPKQLLVNSCVY